MTFRETLDAHLQAIKNRDLQALAATLPARELILIMSDGKLVRSVSEFLELHGGWFASPTWSLGTEIVHLLETPGAGVAVIRLDYRDTPGGGKPIQERSMLTLVFARQNDKWVMVHDQNTPLRAG